ncbi:hypothetical protein [Amycolatopsis tolypomycina]|uniref:hypothetical protein n=1 Tax=Amycolatopsis tolypomycina TaxID=208445 RepID=UPI0033B21350
MTTAVDPDAYARFVRATLDPAELTPWQEEILRTLYLTGYVQKRHETPGPRGPHVRRVDHARARRLYALRLQRDRRRVRAGRAPILRSTSVRVIFPNVHMRLVPGRPGERVFQVTRGQVPQ